MGKHRSKESPQVQQKQVERYLRQQGQQDAKIIAMHPLGQSTQEGLKDYGYGRPLRITYQTQTETGPMTKDVVLRTMSADPFGHDRHSDRAAELLMCAELFAHMPRHIQPLAVGSFDQEGRLHPIADGEFFLLTEYVDGQLYAHDLHRLAEAKQTTALDRERTQALALYLAELHQEQAAPEAYLREIRDTIGSGEGIFGLCDSYPAGHPIATQERLKAIEHQAIEWRWKLRKYSERARRTHGDFHPFNLLFRQGPDFSVLDCSRGGVGEPADDVTALSINYLFFGLQHRDKWEGPLRELWELFWSTYLEKAKDPQICQLVAPFFAWRALVVASPVWYPHIREPLREQMFVFAERLLEGQAFVPKRVEQLLGTQAKQ